MDKPKSVSSSFALRHVRSTITLACKGDGTPADESSAARLAHYRLVVAMAKREGLKLAMEYARRDVEFSRCWLYDVRAIFAKDFYLQRFITVY